MIIIYPSKVNLGENTTLSPKHGNTIPHLVGGIDSKSAVATMEVGKGDVIFLYLAKVPDGEFITPSSLEDTYSINGAVERNEHWITSTTSAKLIGVVEVVGVADGVAELKDLSLEDALNQDIEEMDWLDFYCAALRDKMFTKRKWLLDVFTIKRTYRCDAPWMVGKDEEENIYFTKHPDGHRINIVNVPTTHPVVGLFRKVTAYKGDLVNIKKTVETTTGELLVNALAFCYHYGDFKDYQAGKIMPDDFHAFYGDLLKAGELEDVDRMTKAIAATEQLASYAEFAVPAASRATMSMHPDNERVRNEGIAELGEDINDMAKLAELDAKLIALDKEHVKGSPSETFFIKGKMHGVVRKKTGMMYGSETDLTGNPTPTVTTSLEEGIKIANMPAHVNAVRAGANARGLKTAEGGYDMKEIIRMLSAYVVDVPDCKTSEGIEFTLRPEDVKLYVDRFLVGEKEPLTKERLEKLVGKEVNLRDPSYCKGENFSLCTKCCGLRMSKLKHGVAFEASTLGGAMQDASMQAAHGKSLTVKYYDLDTYCS